MKPVIDHMKATAHADWLTEKYHDCECSDCNLARAYLDLQRQCDELGKVDLSWQKTYEAWPRLVQALSNLAGIVPSMMNVEVWIEYRRTARALLAELGEAGGLEDAAIGVLRARADAEAMRAFNADLDIPTFLRRKAGDLQSRTKADLEEVKAERDYFKRAYEGKREAGAFTNRLLDAKIAECDAARVFVNDVRTALMRYEGTVASKGVKA